MSAVATIRAAPSGSSGSNTHTSVRCHPGASRYGFVLTVESAGATPQISWKVQGACDTDSVADASANWFDLAVIPANSDTIAAIPLVVNPAPAGTVSAVYVSKSETRFAKRVRIVTSGAVNITGYRVDFHEQIG